MMLITPGDDYGRGQVFSTDDRRLLITLGVYSSVYSAIVHWL